MTILLARAAWIRCGQPTGALRSAADRQSSTITAVRVEGLSGELWLQSRGPVAPPPPPAPDAAAKKRRGGRRAESATEWELIACTGLHVSDALINCFSCNLLSATLSDTTQMSHRCTAVRPPSRQRQLLLRQPSADAAGEAAGLQLLLALRAAGTEREGQSATRHWPAGQREQAQCAACTTHSIL